MTHALPFPIQNFEAYNKTLIRVGIDPGFVLYTNHHAGNHQAAARFFNEEQLPAVQRHLTEQSDETFKHLVEIGVLLDNEWDRTTPSWQIISFAGWEVLHTAFSRLHSKCRNALQELTGLSEVELFELT
jgi:hypothetical protein